MVWEIPIQASYSTAAAIYFFCISSVLHLIGRQTFTWECSVEPIMVLSFAGPRLCLDSTKRSRNRQVTQWKQNR